jgi:hypothetical protein
MATKYTKWLQNISDGHKIYQHFPFHGPPKYTLIGIFGMKICIHSGIAAACVTRWVCEKVAQNVAKPICCPNKYKTGTLGKSSPKICVRSVVFEKLPNVYNHPIVENSPNLVALLTAQWDATLGSEIELSLFIW